MRKEKESLKLSQSSNKFGEITRRLKEFGMFVLESLHNFLKPNFECPVQYFLICPAYCPFENSCFTANLQLDSQKTLNLLPSNVSKGMLYVVIIRKRKFTFINGAEIIEKIGMKPPGPPMSISRILVFKCSRVRSNRLKNCDTWYSFSIKQLGPSLG